MNLIDAFWRRFLHEKGLPEETRYIDAFHFDLSERVANELLALVLSGQKRATCSSVFAMEAEGVKPEPGALSIVTDWAGTPRCVIRTTAVTRLRFCDMTYEICSREGEDDNLAQWQEGHTRFFTEEGWEMGYAFSEELPVIFEDFEVVYRE